MKKVFCLLACVLITSGVTANADVKNKEIKTEIATESHMQESKAWNGWDYEKGEYYYYKNGNRQKGWQTIKGSKYYFHKTTGCMYKGEQVIDGKIYNFGLNGPMITGWYSKGVNGYEFYGQDGVKYKKKWHYDGYDWYYLNSVGDMVTGFYTIDDKEYCFRKNGTMVYGWNGYYDEKGDLQYSYHDGSGVRVSSRWIFDNNKWHYINYEGDMLRGAQVINGRSYWFNSDGSQFVGWSYDHTVGKWKYYGDYGMCKNEWLYKDGNWFYFDDSEYMVTGTHYIDGQYYTFDLNGVMK